MNIGKVKLIIEAIKQLATNWNGLGYNYTAVNNSDWDNIDYSKVELIVVADNPGEKERINSRYLIGSAGTCLRNIFSRRNFHQFVFPYRINEQPNWNSANVLILNKSSIHTKYTKSKKGEAGLNTVKKANKNDFNDHLRKMAELTLLLQQEMDIPLVFLGTSNWDGIFLPYKNVIISNANSLSKVGILSHPSNGALSKELNKKAPNTFSDLLRMSYKNRKKIVGV